MDHQRSLNFPSDIEMSIDAQNLIKAFLTDRFVISSLNMEGLLILKDSFVLLNIFYEEI